MKLTKPQIEFLRDAARPCGIGAHDTYPPARKLTAAGLLERRGQRLGAPLFLITDAGRAALLELDGSGG